MSADQPFRGGGPQNLPAHQLQQAWQLTLELKHQRQVQELSECLREHLADLERERDNEPADFI